MDKKPGKFYLGKTYDLEAGKLLDEPVFYDADDLTTHAVCIGMTGSGKTGLGIGLLEEAILQGLPLLIVDPKGDVANLLLQFPNLAPEEFQPWVDPAEAQRKGLALADYAGQVAAMWQKGLADWDLGPADIQRLRQAADYTIYTPGSDAGQPVSILQSFRVPAGGWTGSEEDREQITHLVSALLSLVNIQADPLRSREHILLANLVEHAWQAGQDLDLPGLIQGVQQPPFRKLGVFDVDAFFPPDDRFQLAMLLNGLVAAPTFRAWMEGPALEVQRFLWGPDSRPRVSIFYLAHLSDGERMFFVTLLLEAVRAWLRRQSGSPSLRAILYFDELFGYFPPHPHNPPSKEPLMALLKQARAYGLGLMLTTQNPVDLDYKGLTNAGTWFIGTLQAARDKERLMEGLEGVSAGALSRSYLDRVISSLRKRVFLLHNVHERAPQIFHTRWVMSYLRGPLTRDEVRQLQPAESPAAVPTREVAPAPAAAEALSTQPPTLPPEINQFYVRARLTAEEAVQVWQKGQGRPVEVLERHLHYRPGVVGVAEVYFQDARKGVDERQERGLVSLGALTPRALWSGPDVWPMTRDDLAQTPAGQARYEAVPEAFNEPKELKDLEKSFVDHLYHNARLEIPYHPTLKVYGRPGESEREFRSRCEEAARASRDEELQEAREDFQKKREKLEAKLEKEEMELREDQADHEARKREELLSAGESVLGLFLGRRSSRSLSTASRRRRYTEKARLDVEESLETIEDLKEKIEALDQEEQEALNAIRQKWAEVLEEKETVDVKPRKRDIRTLAFGLAWVPHWAITARDAAGGSTREMVLPALPDEGVD